MKKFISIILTVVLFVTFAATALAESAFGYTPDQVVQRLEEYDQYAEDAIQQAVNASHRLAEDLVYVDSLNANDETRETLQTILDAVAELDNDSEISAVQSLAGGTVQIVRALVVLANEADPNGVYGETLEAIIQNYNTTNDAVQTADEQVVNALYTAVRLAELVVKESCTSQEQIDQIDEGAAQFAADDEAAEGVEAQMAVGAKWLRKMLGAFAKLNNPNCIEDIDSQMEGVENYIASEDMGQKQVLFQYLLASIYAINIFTGYLHLD